MDDRSKINVGGIDGAGATLETKYLKRTQKVVAVSKGDLDSIMHFDLQSSISTGLGMFLTSGSIWLAEEKIFEQVEKPEFELTTAIIVCALCFAFGLYCLGNGLWDRYKKRKRITDIFEETETL